jgi:hypothetical protein
MNDHIPETKTPEPKQSAGKNTLLKLGVSASAGILAVVNQWWKFDTTSLGLFFIAVLPWLSSFLDSAELPGGWKFAFHQVKAEQEKQKEDIDRLKFLIEGFVSEDELKHLKKLDSKEPFLVTVDRTTKFFENELHRLRSLGLIANLPGKGIGTLLINDGRPREVKEHLHITEKGKEYLRLRNADNAS